MQSRTRFIALGLACAALAACSHKDKDAPLAFVPADTPYVAANLAVLDDDTRKALLAQANLQLPSQVAQMEAYATRLQASDPDAARLVQAFAAEYKGKTVEGFAQSTGFDLKGRFALYGEGMAPVLRVELSDPAAFDGFVARLETAYGKKLDTATIGKQTYRLHVFPASGAELVLAVVGKQMVGALLPADAATPLLRQTLGLDRPAKSLQDDGRLDTLASDKGYAKWLVGQFDLTRALPLVLTGSDPLVAAVEKARASAESAQTGEPVANLLKNSPDCAPEASRIAARVPAMSFGYTRLDATHQDARFDLALADDIAKAFSGLKVELPGLGSGASTAPFDFSLALPVAALRTFWSAQAEAVAAKPFACPMLTDLNDSFAKLGDALPKTAIPPFGNLLGLRVALDTLGTDSTSSLPDFTGRIVLGTSDPAGLLATGQMMVPALATVKTAANAAPVALPKDVTGMLGQPSWLASGDKALALGIGSGEDAKLAGTLHDASGEPGQMARMHLSGAMYLDWLKFMEKKSDSLAAAAAEMSKNDEPPANGEPSPANEAAQAAADAARSKAQFAAMEAQAQRVDGIDAEMHVTDSGIVVTSHTTLKQ
ncbi:hypothetical protein IHE49_01040 [Rhodanobacter sp. 7MK24]|uniref:hypothetical protein n=1 Tax=Rhodanobacter sp. 7MK24 TaxID=2775922 RepID=UPI00177B049F|nr:hypothetical protein [Rhodanobacter sp. 7MK24]MBD8879060.1 hypothetical protein [Rhodanobacter sp. 7MK24]